MAKRKPKAPSSNNESIVESTELVAAEELGDDLELETISEEDKAMEARNKRIAFQEMMARVDNPWGYSAGALESKQAAMTMLSTKTGLYSRIPIVCKGCNCPYGETCGLLEYGLDTVGERCVLETTMIEQKLANYTEEFGLDESSYTDWTMVKELINAEIMIERCMALMSQEGCAITEEFIGTSEGSGIDYFRKEISKTQELYERNLKIKERILDTMMGTRKAKSKLRGADNDEKSLLDNIFEMDFIEDEKPDHLN